MDFFLTKNFLFPPSFAIVTLCTKDLRPIILRFHVARGNDSASSQKVWFVFKTEISQTVRLVKLFRHFLSAFAKDHSIKKMEKMSEQFHQSHCLTYFSLESKRGFTRGEC